MAVNGFTNIVTDGLVLSLDAGNLKSYPTTGTTWTDLSKNGNNGTLTNCTFNSSVLGSITFNGNNSVVGLGDSDLFSFTNGVTDLPFSISGWFKLNAYGTGAAVYSSFMTKSQNNGSIWIREWSFSHVNSTGFVLVIFNPDSSGGNYIGKSINSPLSLNVWYHLTATYDGSKTNAGIVLYINGVLQSSVNANSGTYTGMGNTTATVELGRQFYSGDSGYLNGNISSIQIYRNKVLSASEVLQNYNATKWRFI